MARRVTLSIARMALSLALAAAASSVHAADIHGSAGTRAFPTLKIGVGAEAIGMGETGVALAKDAYAPAWNPAGLVKVRRSQVALTNNEWVLDLRQHYAAYAAPLGEKAGGAISASFFNYGEIQGRDDSGAATTTFRPYDVTIGVGAGLQVAEGVSVGANAKYLRQQIDDASAQGGAVDLGVSYDVPETSLSLGAAIQHIGTSLAFDAESFSLPTTVRTGLGYRVADDQATIAVDVSKPADNDARIGIGIAYDIVNALTVRGGYRYEIGGNELGSSTGLTGGFGVRYAGFVLDYAFVSYGDLGPTNRVSLIAEF